MKLLHRLRSALGGHPYVTFCDSCGQVCDAKCRAGAIRERAIGGYLTLPRI
ncbi:MAG: hypothetical protein ABJB98_11690 [Actinomycetota bacterium]